MIQIDPAVLQQIDQCKAVLNALEKIQLKGEFVANSRERGTNADILRYQAERGRDFVSPTDKNVQEISQAVCDAVIAELQTMLNSKTKLHISQSDINKRASKIAGEKWLDEIRRRIESQDWMGDGSDKLSPGYARKKQAKHGFDYPVGVASGRVKDNVAQKQNLKTK